MTHVNSKLPPATQNVINRHSLSPSPLLTGHNMFPEYREEISRLKTEDAHFSRLFNLHNDLDHQIKNMESGIVVGTHESIENLKKEKLRLKDQLYVILRKTAGN